jgi:hypothetical protein
MRRALAWVCVLLAARELQTVRAAHATAEVTLAPRPFAAQSPAAPFQAFFLDARRRSAATTPAWDTADDDLSAWGPALIFPLLGSGVSAEVVLQLAAPLEADATAQVLLFRTLGLYAAKGRVPFASTPTLLAAVRRNLRTMERATRDLDSFTMGSELVGWGSIGVGAWLAYLELLYRDYGALEDDDAAHWNADGVRIVDQLLVRGRLPGQRGFRRDPRDSELTLLPNALALYALTKAYENEELIVYETAARDTVAALDVLRDRDGAYFSTTARTEKDARANAYLAGALLLLFKDTGDARLRDQAAAILRWLTSANRPTVSGVTRDAQTAYLTLLLDSLATQPSEDLLGRRPMHSAVEANTPAAQTVHDVAARLRPKDFRYRSMLDALLETLLTRTPYATGDFAYDYGDSPGYATSVLLRGGDAERARQIVQRQERLLTWPRPRDFDELSFGSMALLAATDHVDGLEGTDAFASLRRYVFLSGVLAVADRYYCDWLDWFTGGGGFDYGPTVIGAQIADPQLRFAERFPGTRVGWVIDPLHVGRALLVGADRSAWDPVRRVYRIRPGVEVVAVLPNAMMIIDLLHAQTLDPSAGYLARAEEVASGLDALWDDARGAYDANSELTGEQGYQSLSTNSYAAIALLRLQRATGKERYRERAERIFEFIARDLYDDGIVYHHVYRGHRATGDIWCSGCNWRVVHSLAELAAVPPAPQS